LAHTGINRRLFLTLPQISDFCSPQRVTAPARQRVVALQAGGCGRGDGDDAVLLSRSRSGILSLIGGGGDASFRQIDPSSDHPRRDPLADRWYASL
jgi:hypothetical protein